MPIDPQAQAVLEQLAAAGAPPLPLDPVSSPSPARWRQSGAYPGPADGQEQEHTSQRGVDTHARAQCAAPTAPARTASLHGRGEERLGIEEHGAVTIVLRERINIREVAVHDGRHRLPRIVGMFQPEYMPQFVEQDPLDIDSGRETQCLFTQVQWTGIGVPTEIRIQHHIGLRQEEVP